MKNHSGVWQDNVDENSLTSYLKVCILKLIVSELETGMEYPSMRDPMVYIHDISDGLRITTYVVVRSNKESSSVTVKIAFELRRSILDSKHVQWAYITKFMSSVLVGIMSMVANRLMRCCEGSGVECLSFY